MASLNRVQIIGRLGKDPSTHSTKNGKQYTTFSVAVDHSWKKKDGSQRKETDWFNVEAWGGLGEICSKYLSKGRLVFLEGRLRTNRYEQDGETRYFTKIVASQMQMLDRKMETEPQEEKPAGKE